ncbi:MAG TPA: hypothetical protein VMV03_17450 [Spirochaetia bacterium]|nr:hypothetical protein [Spirochaetia bacterium]
MEVRYVIPKIAFPGRLVLLAGFAALGFALQVALPGAAGAALGTLLMVPGLLFVSARSFRNKPLDVGQEDWQPASVREFDRIRSNLQLTRHKRYAVIYRAGFGWFTAIVLVIVTFILVGSGLRFAALVCFDFFVLLIPFLLTGNVFLWTPQELAFRMRVFDPILSTEQAEGGDIIITPYLRLDRDKEGHQIPEDIRLMVEPRRKPKDFLGVQLQVAVNKGPNGNVPYMYAVFLCRGKGETYHAVSSMRFDGYVREPGGDKEYGYVVVRQETSGTGYHTTDADVRRLYEMVKDKLLVMMKG